MKVVCVDACIRSRAFGIDIALRNRFELFEEMKVPYVLMPLLGSLCWIVIKPWELIGVKSVFWA